MARSPFKGPWNFSVRAAFSLIELLVVITLLGILAGLSVPVLKNLGKSNVQASATRQLLDDVGRARQLAISQRTTVYMVFVPQWNRWWNGSLSAAEMAAETNLLDKQLTGYTFVALRAVGDQPGWGVPRYLSDWKSLPEGAFIATNKFIAPWQYYYIANLNPNTRIYGFVTNNPVPFPTENSQRLLLPYIAFNYLGQLTVDGQTMASQDEYIPLAQGSVNYATDANKNLVPGPADVAENPPGSSTNSMFRVIRIDRLTGRATLLQQKVQ